MATFGQGKPGEFILEGTLQDDSSYLIEVSFDRDHANKLRKQYYKSKKKNLNMDKFPGFRPGKVPFNVFEKRFDKKDIDGFYAEFFSNKANLILMDESSRKVLFTNNHYVESQPNGWWKVEFQAWLEAEVVVPDNFGDDAEINVELVTPESYVDQRIQSFAKLHPYLWRKTTDDGDPLPAADGDMVEVAIECWVDGEKYEPGCVESTNIRLIKGAVHPEEIYTEMMGKKEGDSFEVVSTDVPKAFIRDLNNKEVTVKIIVSYVYNCVEPNIDDDLAITAGFDSFKDWHQYLMDSGERWAKSQNEMIHRTAVCDYVDENLECEEYPQALAVQKAIEVIRMRGKVESPDELVEQVKTLATQVTKMKAVGEKFGIEWADSDKSIYGRDEKAYADKVINFLTDKLKFNYVDAGTIGDLGEDRKDGGGDGQITSDREELGAELQDQVPRGGDKEPVSGVSENVSIGVQEGNRS